MVMVSDDMYEQLFRSLLWQAPELGRECPDEIVRESIHPESQEKLKDYLRSFVGSNLLDITLFMEHTERDWLDIAHNFVMTANRTGVGFWERCLCGDGDKDDAAARLTEEAYRFPMELYVGVDGFVHLS